MDTTTKEEITLMILAELRQLRTNSDTQTKILRNLQASWRGPTPRPNVSANSKRRDAFLKELLNEL